MLGQVTRVKAADTYGGIDEDNFDRPISGTLGAGWEPAAWTTYALGISGHAAVDSGLARFSGNVRRPLILSDLNEYTISYDIKKPLGVQWQRSIKHIYARMDDINPNALTEGIDAILVTEMSDEFVYSGRLRVYMGGAIVAQNEFPVGSLGLGVSSVRFAIAVLGNNVTVTLDGSVLWTGVVAAQPGLRVGLASTMLGVHWNSIDNWIVTGGLIAGEPVENETRLVVSTGGRMYAETTPGDLARLADPDAILSSNHSIMCVEQGARLWIADYGGTSVPKVYDPADNSVAEWTAAPGLGAVPQHCRLLCLYRNRTVLASPPGAMREWYMSHVDNPRDWDYADVTALGAVAGTAANAGQMGQEIRALIPYSDDYLIFGCAHSIWRMSGDPKYGGLLDAVDYKTGMLDKFAWAHDPHANIWFMGMAGLYRMQPGQKPEAMSPFTLPRELSNINTQAYEVILAWNTVWFGLHIFITSRLDGTSQHWFYDAKEGAYWPEQIPNDHGPTAVLDYGSDSSRFRKLLLGGRDGYIRNFEENVSNDDGETITSYVVFAPQRIAGRDDREGILQLVQLALGLNTDTLDYGIRVADTHEEAAIAKAKKTGMLRGGGLTSPERMRIRGGSMALIVGNKTFDERWAYEKGFARAVDGGIARIGQGRKLLQPLSDIPAPPIEAGEDVPPSLETPSPELPPYPTPEPTIPIPPTPSPTPEPTPSPTPEPTPTPSPTPEPTPTPSPSPTPTPTPSISQSISISPSISGFYTLTVRSAVWKVNFLNCTQDQIAAFWIACPQLAGDLHIVIAGTYPGVTEYTAQVPDGTIVELTAPAGVGADCGGGSTVLFDEWVSCGDSENMGPAGDSVSPSPSPSPSASPRTIRFRMDGDVCVSAQYELAKECDASLSPSISPSTSGPVNDCNDCDPKLPDTMYVTWHDLFGDFFGADEVKLTVQWVGGCTWYGEWGIYRFYVFYDFVVDGDYWTASLFAKPGGQCAMSATSPTATPCDPYETIARTGCFSSTCDDINSCTDSSGASATVSES